MGLVVEYIQRRLCVLLRRKWCRGLVLLLLGILRLTSNSLGLPGPLQLLEATPILVMIRLLGMEIHPRRLSNSGRITWYERFSQLAGQLHGIGRRPEVHVAQGRFRERLAWTPGGVHDHRFDGLRIQRLLLSLQVALVLHGFPFKVIQRLVKNSQEAECIDALRGETGIRCDVALPHFLIECASLQGDAVCVVVQLYRLQPPLAKLVPQHLGLEYEPPGRGPLDHELRLQALSGAHHVDSVLSRVALQREPLWKALHIFLYEVDQLRRHTDSAKARRVDHGRAGIRDPYGFTGHRRHPVPAAKLADIEVALDLGRRRHPFQSCLGKIPPLQEATHDPMQQRLASHASKPVMP
mmetsp:Transcript_16686/g.53785  ORF Transcript_16686/g.53785 Transcript_16686/m.53785 type:complete len:352 (+) Transcript_16686:73-1128(+)